MKRLWLGCLAAVAATLLILALAQKCSQDRPRGGVLGDLVERVVEDVGNGFEASVWVGGTEEGAWYERQSSTVRPAASAVKTALLIEFFAKHSTDLDAPLPGVDQMLEGDRLLAVPGWNLLGKIEARRVLRGVTVRRLGEAMMAKSQVSHEAYNTAANLVIEDLGGPETATEKIHARDPSFASIRIGTFIMEPKPHENEATAAALAAVLRRLATHNVPGVDEQTIEAMRQAMFVDHDSPFGTLYSKIGGQPTDPITVVRSGWWEGDRGIVVYVVITVQPNPGPYSRELAWAHQSTATDYLMQSVVRAGWKHLAAK